ncbi:MAG: hypothetical protein QOD31_642, partial [Pseudonocardiales bacterium]|nr:hypothetical protein [Pseudonocardiales bacterium]
MTSTGSTNSLEDQLDQLLEVERFEPPAVFVAAATTADP